MEKKVTISQNVVEAPMAALLLRRAEGERP